MDYRITERYYGPDIRPRDWTGVAGDIHPAGGALHVVADPEARTVRDPWPQRTGGDLEQVLRLDFDALDAGGRAEVRFNDRIDRNEPFGVRFVIEPDAVSVFLKDHRIARKPMTVETHRAHELKLVTVGEQYECLLDGEQFAAGEAPVPFQDNEGWTTVSASRCHLRLLAFEENHVTCDVDFPAWRRGELLYEASWEPERFRREWVCNAPDDGAGPERLDGDGAIFRAMSNNVVREVFEGPLAVDYLATPVPTPAFTAGVTDAIFLWMAGGPHGCVDALEQANRDGTAALSVLHPLPLYWVDFGGTNNVTTRLRKNPGRHLMRQYTDRARLMRRDHTYRITAVANGRFVEFWADGEPIVRVCDPHPHTAGNVGVRAFCSHLKIEELKVWRITS